MIRPLLLSVALMPMAMAMVSAQTLAQEDAAAAPSGDVAKPNILMIMSDDVGITNPSAYSRGMAGYHTPHIDRIANQGVLFTDYYAEQSCTAGRSAFIAGQSPIRTGLTKVGSPGASIGIQKEDPTLAELLKPLGYATGQFGKNHLGDRNESLPTVHGFHTEAGTPWFTGRQARWSGGGVALPGAKSVSPGKFIASRGSNRLFASVAVDALLLP